MKLYIDTNIYLDYFIERWNSDEALRLFWRSAACEFYIVVSDQVLYELNKHLNYEKTVFLFTLLKEKIIKINADEEDWKMAQSLPTHLADALHVVLAKKAGADLIITRNIRDFQGLFEAKRPEEV